MSGNMLKEMRALTKDYEVPQDGCKTYHRSFESLIRFEADLHRHVHKERNILFPRLQKMLAAAAP